LNLLDEPNPNQPRILLVDDDRHARLFLKARLAFLGAQIDDAVDGLDALEALGRHLPDLILSDAVMPRMDGFEFCRKVRQDPALRQLPFCLLSSLKQNMRERSQEAGADDYLSKQENDLVFRIRTRLMMNLALRAFVPSLEQLRLNELSVLVITRSRAIQTQLATHLAKEGIALAWAETPQAGLDHLKSRGADLLILDLDQDEDALDVLIDNLRVHRTLSELPILALSSREEEPRLEARENEIQDRLSKPLDGQESRHRVKLLLRLAGAGPRRG
jgi:two-component system cell cycle response regulator